MRGRMDDLDGRFGLAVALAVSGADGRA